MATLGSAMEVNQFHPGLSLEEALRVFGSIDPQLMMDYVRFKVNCCTSYKDKTDPEEFVTKYPLQFHARNITQVQAGAVAGNAADCLELGIRLWTGCGTREDPDRAMHWWKVISEETHPNFTSTVPRSIHARALSCLADAHWEKRIVDDGDTWNIDSVFRAGSSADASVSLGFVSPTILTVGAGIERLLANVERVPGIDYIRFDNLEFLREAVEKRHKEMEHQIAKRDMKVSKAPAAYRCAAQGCGIEATKKSGLFRCAGKCPAELKPSYCSKECQKADWKIHKAVCKADAKFQSKMEEGKDITSGAEPSPAPPVDVDDDSTVVTKTDGKEHVIEWPAPGRPGETMKVSSTTMTPAFMKQVRQCVESELESSQGGQR